MAQMAQVFTREHDSLSATLMGIGSRQSQELSAGGWPPTWKFPFRVRLQQKKTRQTPTKDRRGNTTHAWRINFSNETRRTTAGIRSAGSCSSAKIHGMIIRTSNANFRTYRDGHFRTYHRRAGVDRDCIDYPGLWEDRNRSRTTESPCRFEDPLLCLRDRPTGMSSTDPFHH